MAKTGLKRLVVIVGLWLGTVNMYAQLTNGVTGLLHMPSADMQRDGTLMVGGNYLNTHNLPNQRYWSYDTYNYFLNVTFLQRLEVAYICTLVKGQEGNYWPKQTWGKFVNQDRHFAVRLQVLKEGELWKYTPSIVLGVSDPTTGSGGDYTNLSVDGEGNGYFNRWYVAATKHFYTRYGNFGLHVAYLYNRRADYSLNSPAAGITFQPNFHPNLNLIVEYDAKTFNIGATYSIWRDHFLFLLELQKGKYVSAGMVYKVNLLGRNQWRSRKNR